MAKYRIINSDGLSNYHTHTIYCDGDNSAEEMVEEAYKLGFRTIGFSGHQYSEPDKKYAMSPENEKAYVRDIKSLKEAYKDRLKVFLGIERDSFCRQVGDYEYVIGSTHNLEVTDGWISVDASPEITENTVKEYFDGDYMAYVRAYYEREASVLKFTNGQIVGHFDLITKFNKGNKYFDEGSREYMRMALKSAEEIIESYIPPDDDYISDMPDELRPYVKEGKPIFEINTGAMTNGRRDIPYPAPFILEYLAKREIPLLLNSDCHRKDFLDFGFKEILSKYNV